MNGKKIAMVSVYTLILTALFGFSAVAPTAQHEVVKTFESTRIDICEPDAVEETTLIEDVHGVTNEEIELIALVTMAEAEGESELGKRLVIDTILNRVDHDRFPDTIHEVVYQKNQFESMWNGRVDRCYVRDDICQLVKEELASRTDDDVIFFQMYNYSPYGAPLYIEGCHYFSAYR